MLNIQFSFFILRVIPHSATTRFNSRPGRRIRLMILERLIIYHIFNQDLRRQDGYVPHTVYINGFHINIEKQPIALIKRYEKYAEEYGDEYGR